MRPDGLRIDLGRQRQDIEALAGIGTDPAGGISRPAWSPAHEEARVWLLGRLQEAGLAARVDPAGNVFGRLGEETPVVMTGSHIDTAPPGGDRSTARSACWPASSASERSRRRACGRPGRSRWPPSPTRRGASTGSSAPAR